MSPAIPRNAVDEDLEERINEIGHTEKSVVDEKGDMITLHYCNKCTDPKPILRSQDMRRHKIRQHIKPPQFFCPLRACSRSREGFSQKANMRNHLKTVHLKETKYHCPHLIQGCDSVYSCMHSFYSKSSLIRHRWEMHGFLAGDDPQNVSIPTPAGTRFPRKRPPRGRRGIRYAEAAGVNQATIPSENTGNAAQAYPTPARPLAHESFFPTRLDEPTALHPSLSNSLGIPPNGTETRSVDTGACAAPTSIANPDYPTLYRMYGMGPPYFFGPSPSFGFSPAQWGYGMSTLSTVGHVRHSSVETVSSSS